MFMKVCTQIKSFINNLYYINHKKIRYDKKVQEF